MCMIYVELRIYHKITPPLKLKFAKYQAAGPAGRPARSGGSAPPDPVRSAEAVARLAHVPRSTACADLDYSKCIPIL